MKRLVALAVLIGSVSLAFAQSADPQAPQRPVPIPASATPAMIRHVEGMNIELDGQPQRLSPGAQVRDEANRIIVPMQIPSGVQVKYLLDAEGLVNRVWILTEDEKVPAAPPPQPLSPQQ